MNIVAVTSCPVGMAHTYMAMTALKESAEKFGVEMKVETQGMMGIRDELTRADIDEADAAILTNDVVIEKEERFNNILTYQTTTSEIIKKSDQVIEETIKLINKRSKS
jgi:fructose-specific PTS system IIB-like component